ncbi:MAG: SpoIIE family protein phosphatase [Myxococcota bacterium]|nr:SpoIIE family protein phosphatase [Myxococcota bacterium]
MARTTTFQRRLFRNLSVNILLLAVLILVVGSLGVRYAGERIATELTGRALADTRAAFARFLEPVASLVELSARHFSVSGMDLDDPERLDRYFLPILATIGQVSGAALAHEDGRSYALHRTSAGWERRLSDPATHPGRSFVSRWSGQGSEPVELWEDLAYDARQRPWFTGAIAKSPNPDRARASGRDAIHLTRPYDFELPARDRGVAVGLSFRAPDGSVGVISFDLLLRDITTFASGLGLERAGNVVMVYRDIERDEALLEGLGANRASHANRAKGREEALERYFVAPPTGAGDILLDFTAELLVHDGEDRLRPRRFESQDQGWWGAAAGYRDEVMILAVFPEAELLGEFEELTLFATVLTVLLLSLVVWRSSRLSRVFARPIEELADQTERMAGMNFHGSGEVDTNIEEIQILAHAQEQLRRSLEVFASRQEDLLIAKWMRERAMRPSGVAPEGYELGVLDQAMEAVGGSVLDAETHPDSPAQLSLLLAAVPGEGVAAAFQAGRLRSVFQTTVRLRTGLEEQARLIRSSFAGASELDAPLGVAVAQLDAAEGTLAVLAEPACPALHFAAETAAFHWIESGLAPERVPFAAGDTALLLTQSVLHALSPDRARFGRERLEEIVRKHAQDDAETVARSIGAALAEFTDGAAPERDRTVLVLRYAPARATDA